MSECKLFYILITPQALQIADDVNFVILLDKLCAATGCIILSSLAKTSASIAADDVSALVLVVDNILVV
jgi:hypothetical protein